MSTEYEGKLIVGNYLNVIESSGKVQYEGSRWDLRDLLEDEDMLHCEDNDFVGFVVNQNGALEIGMSTAQRLSRVAEEFKNITGVEALVEACVWSY